jgi:hypothetical protein
VRTDNAKRVKWERCKRMGKLVKMKNRSQVTEKELRGDARKQRQRGMVDPRRMKGVNKSRDTEETRWREDGEGGRVARALVVMVNTLLVLHDHLKPLQNLMHLSRQNARHGPPKARLQLLHTLLQQLQI